ncbi:MAG: hypothetical protein DMF63_16350 [Acidobacteria bacterium]|nr:MAG: hypothetical protein DMF63_16350 [Acidobacteriota bacterium]
MSISRTISAIAYLLFVAAAWFAQGGPPMITDDTGTVAKGHFEINTAFTMEFGEDGRLWGTPLIDFNYGTSKNTQIKVEIPYYVLHVNGQAGVQGLGNTNVGVRWRFRDGDEKGKLALSLYPQIEFNTPGSAARRVGIVDRGPEFLLPLQWEMHWGKTGVNGDVGYRFKRGEDEAIYGVLIGREFKRFDLLAEIHGTGSRRHLASGEVVFNIGTRVPLTKHATWIMSGGRSVRPGHDPTFVGYAGVQWTF